MDLVNGINASEAKKIEGALTLGIGILTWEVAATTPFDIGVSPFSQQRFADAIAQTFGPNVAKAIFPNVGIRGIQAITPWGALNKYTGMGISLLVLDAALDSLVGTEYRKMDGLGAFIRGTGKGLTAGGVVGGFFNPPTAGSFRGPTPSAYPAAAPAPQLTVYTGAAASVNRMLGG